MTKSEILAATKIRTGRTDLTDIDTELYAVLVDMTARHAFLKDSATQALADGTPNYAFPTNANRILFVTESLTSNASDDTEPVREISFNDYLYLKQSASDEGEPEYYAVFNKYLYFYPTPNTTYTATIYYQKLHPSDLDSILLGDEYKECVIEGVCFKVMEGLGIGAEDGAIHYQNYETALSVLANKVKDKEVNTVDGYY
ncbi:MAG: hypothetical protein PHF74_05590 [Dehalococcoidales bacterium]|nr:hypothetical protein [Dehalococcoidales bacterium]